jgi:phosphate transport system substrate-binding protein
MATAADVMDAMRSVLLIIILTLSAGSFGQARQAHVQAGSALTGAGATFPAPIYRKWIDSFEARHPGLPIVYETTGSEEGLRKLRRGEIDFAASDIPPRLEDEKWRGFEVLPAVVGAVVPAYNIPGLQDHLLFTPDVLAGIYLGQITTWNDARIVKLNHGIKLPSSKIVVVHRSDGSGTTYIWSDYLSKVSRDWRSTVGVGGRLKWPVGVGAVGNEGVADLVTKTPFSIGYVEFIYAVHQHLSYGAVRNQAGKFVRASIDTLTAAAAAVPPGGKYRVSLTDASGSDAYPIASFTWFVIPADLKQEAKRQRLKAWVDWFLTYGQKQAAALGYVPLPEGIAENAREAASNLFRTQ